MPGENLQKLNKSELTQLREIVRRIYFKDFTEEEKKVVATDYHCDQLIDSLLPETIEQCKEIGSAKGFIGKKKFFLPSKILAKNGNPILCEDK